MFKQKAFGGEFVLEIKPETTKDKIRLKKCLELKKYIPDISDELITEIYEFLKESATNVVITRDMVCFYTKNDSLDKVSIIAHLTKSMDYEYIELTDYGYYELVASHGQNSGYYGGGCTSCGGCSSNNNNNNNNNNG